MAKMRILLCSVDGMRPDAVQRADTPTVKRLAQEGAHTWRARTVMPSVTLPCHTSMLRGVDTARHGITDNTFHPLARPVPSLIDAAAAQGKSVGFFYNWEQLRDLAAPGSLTVGGFHGNAGSAASDAWVADRAIDAMGEWDLDLLFVYFGYTDECGHKDGWMSQPYLEAIAHADTCLGRVHDAFTAQGGVVTLVTSDHGGHERSHGTERDDDMFIPWILHGPGIRVGAELADGVRIFDTAPTLAHLLGLRPAPYWEGRVVTEAFSVQRE